jgi:uncharacterized protein YejL (UPF0352 family)
MNKDTKELLLEIIEVVQKHKIKKELRRVTPS